MTGPLAGLRVLDVTTTFSGPYCTYLLSDLGADVIKIETPTGDVTRAQGTVRTQGLGSVFVNVNRNKASTILDLKTDEDAGRLRALLTEADVLVHNMRLRAATKLGIDYDTARALNPSLVHCEITGFDSSGPYVGRPAYDDTIQAASGMVWLQSQGAGAREGEGAYMYSPVADKTTGLMAAYAITAALAHRSRTNVGQRVEVPMFETMVSWTLMEQLGGHAFIPPSGPVGYERLRHRKPYRTSDGMIAVVVYHGAHWRRYLDFIGQGDLLEKDDFRDAAARNHNIGKLYAILDSMMPTRTTKEWLAIFEVLDIPATEVSSIEDLFDDEHLRAIGFFGEIEDAEGNAYLGVRSSLRFSESPAVEPRDMRPPQMLGEGAAALERWNGSRSRWTADTAQAHPTANDPA